MAREIDVANPETRALEQRVERAENLVRNMLEDKEFFHIGKNYNEPRKGIETDGRRCRTDHGRWRRRFPGDRNSLGVNR